MSLDVAELYTTHYALIRTYVRRRMVGVDDAAIEDVISDVWEGVVRAAPRYRESGVPISAWLHRIARNRLADHYRQQFRKTTFVGLDSIKPWVLHVGTDRHAAMLDVRHSMTRLSSRQRSTVQARLVDGWSIQQTMALLGQTMDSVKQAQVNGVKNLRKALEVAA